MKKKFFISLFVCALAACTKTPSPTHSLEVAAKGFHSAAISEDGAFVLVGSIYHGGSFWRMTDEERLFNWNHQSDELTTIVAADFSDNGKWAVSAAPHTMVLWNTDSGKGERYWTAPAEVLDIELNRQGSIALLGLEDHSAVIFDIRRGGIRRVFQHQNRVRSVDFSAQADIAITGSEDYTASIWDTASGERMTTIRHEDDVQFVQLSDDGNVALSVSKYDKALIWKTRDAEIVTEIPLNAEHLKRGIRFTSARFSADNRLLVTGRPDQIVQLWEIETARELARWKLPKRNAWKPTSAAVLDVAFDKNNSTIIAAASNGFVHHLELATDRSPQGN